MKDTLLATAIIAGFALLGYMTYGPWGAVWYAAIVIGVSLVAEAIDLWKAEKGNS